MWVRYTSVRVHLGARPARREALRGQVDTDTGKQGERFRSARRLARRTVSLVEA